MFDLESSMSALEIQAARTRIPASSKVSYVIVDEIETVSKLVADVVV